MAQKRKFGKITYRDHTGVILDDAQSIQDDITHEIYPTSLHWVRFWDVQEGRPPPKMQFPEPYIPPPPRQPPRPSSPPPMMFTMDEFDPDRNSFERSQTSRELFASEEWFLDSDTVAYNPEEQSRPMVTCTRPFVIYEHTGNQESE
jgi:hypothetical protein